MIATISKLRLQQESFNTFSKEQGDEQVEEWKAMVRIWESDPNAPNPYELPKSGRFMCNTTRPSSWVIIGLSEADVQLQLAQEEADQAAMGVPSLHEVSASLFIVAALDLEDQQ